MACAMPVIYGESGTTVREAQRRKMAKLTLDAVLAVVVAGLIGFSGVTERGQTKNSPRPS